MSPDTPTRIHPAQHHASKPGTEFLRSAAAALIADAIAASAFRKDTIRLAYPGTVPAENVDRLLADRQHAVIEVGVLKAAAWFEGQRGAIRLAVIANGIALSAAACDPDALTRLRRWAASRVAKALH